MSQMSFGDSEYAAKKKTTRREVFLAEMDQIVPWKTLLAQIEPFYPLGARGRPPYPLNTMLRVHLMQNWFGLADEAMEEALYEIVSMRKFAGLRLTGPIPDETTILNFRRRLEDNDLARVLFDRINAHLTRKGLLLKQGTIVDATIINAPSSTKNADGQRDPEMHQAKKGEQWYFGMKAHIGADADSGLVHTVVATPANEADVAVVDELLHGQERVVYGDSGYTGADKSARRRGLRWSIASRPSQLKALKDDALRDQFRAIEQRKASIRAKVEHPFRVIKRQFGLMKVRFKGLAKNTAHVVTLFALANLWLARKRLLAMAGKVRPATG